jgi:prephenate dehydrogenase
VLDEYIASLQTFREAIAAHDPHLNELFARAQEQRQQWQMTHDRDSLT